MSPKLRNTAVGLVVLASLSILGWMLIKFGAEPAKFLRPPQITVTFVSERGDGLGEGSNVSYKGVTVGRVSEVRRDPETDRIIATAFINKVPPLPADITADIVFTSPLGGVSALELKRKPASSAAPGGATAAPGGSSVKVSGFEPLADGATIEARYLGSTFLPPEFADLARNLNESVRQFNDARLIDSLRETVELTKKRIDETGKVIDGIGSLVNDPKVRDDLTGSLTALRATAENAQRISDRIEKLTDRVDAIAASTDKAVNAAKTTFDTSNKRIDEIGISLGQQLVKVSQMLDQVTDISRKINTGTGTAGQLINDPKLYQALVDSSRELNATITDFRRLVQQWEQEGVTLKLGK